MFDSLLENGIEHVLSKHSVSETIDKLESVAKSLGLMVFARIDFSADAKSVSLELPAKQLLIFGNPKGGTPLMQASPSIAIDLPMKILAWEDEDGKVWVSYNKPEYLSERHQIPEHFKVNLSAITKLVDKIT